MNEQKHTPPKKQAKRKKKRKNDKNLLTPSTKNSPTKLNSAEKKLQKQNIFPNFGCCCKTFALTEFKTLNTKISILQIIDIDTVQDRSRDITPQHDTA